MNQELLTIKEIARRLDLPESNIRYYRDRFDRFLPSVGHGRKKRYKPEAVEVFRCIVEELGQSRSTQEIEEVLAARFSQNPSQVTWQQDSLSPAAYAQSGSDATYLQEALVTQSRALDKLSRAMQLERGLFADLQQMQSRQDRLKRAVYLLWKGYQKSLSRDRDGHQPGEVEKLREEVESLETRQTELEEKLESELKSMREELQKCQFWTKRLLMQSAREKTEPDKGEESQAGT
ncbi:MerR family transcriptional regulator [Desulfonatronospira sp. MSAO_Bac3]|uniref:MerR family transcriptional regulator n=1 Tax=Desulfonatronospira sp. MSAO_Bac3 TaxID=2293857 RepID=UPI000FF22999|nr:MerR family transcriptional regulator [Desulfonatronospira sp. MSAO_Bac3]RQD76423.1 MAG: MerR family transcriptional regulator [Desulfonatronospira sp. MSAO_Bac3]